MQNITQYSTNPTSNDTLAPCEDDTAQCTNTRQVCMITTYYLQSPALWDPQCGTRRRHTSHPMRSCHPNPSSLLTLYRHVRCNVMFRRKKNSKIGNHARIQHSAHQPRGCKRSVCMAMWHQLLPNRNIRATQRKKTITGRQTKASHHCNRRCYSVMRQSLEGDSTLCQKSRAPDRYAVTG